MKARQKLDLDTSQSKPTKARDDLKLPKIPLSLIIIAGLVGLIVVSFSAWLLIRDFKQDPDFEETFWNTIEANFQTKSLEMQTRIVFHPDYGPIDLISTNNKFNLAYPYQMQSHKSSLRFHHQLYADAPADYPQEIRYNQAIQALNNQIYLQRSLQPEELGDSIMQALTIPSATVPKLGSTWYKVDRTDLSKKDDLQLYLMASSLIHGVGYSYLPPQDRLDLVDQLRQIYEIDFAKTTKLYDNDRLLYQYEVQVDYQKLAQFVIDYFNKHISDEDLHIPGFERVDFDYKVNYQIIIDARSQTVVKIKHDLVFPFFGGWQIPNSDFDINPYSSQLLDAILQYAPSLNNQALSVEIDIVSQNEKISFDLPEEFEILNTQSTVKDNNQED